MYYMPDIKDAKNDEDIIFKNSQVKGDKKSKSLYLYLEVRTEIQLQGSKKQFLRMSGKAPLKKYFLELASKHVILQEKCILRRSLGKGKSL